MAGCTGFIEPLNLECLLINVFAGSVEIFMFVAFIAISALAARFRMPNLITMIMFGLFGILMAQYFAGLYVFVVLIAGLVSFTLISRVVKR